MNRFEESPLPPPDPDPESEVKPPRRDDSLKPLPPEFTLDAVSPVATTLPAPLPFPEDLQVSWSWPHFLSFAFFGVISLVTIQLALATYLAPHRHLSAKEFEKYLVSNPKFTIGSMLLWYAALFFFLYVTLSVLRGHSFWQCLGWRKIRPRLGELPRNPVIYFLAGCGLSLFVAILSSQIKTPENIPMEELFKHRQTALLFMAMAVLVAPLVEETLFRGYLYPFLTRSICSILKFFGVEQGAALRSGIAGSVVLTGICFGTMHGEQLGWTAGLVLILTIVGVIFTLVRARTGSVFASYLMHLGYNSLISFFAILGTHGFTKLPPGR